MGLIRFPLTELPRCLFGDFLIAAIVNHRSVSAPSFERALLYSSQNFSRIRLMKRTVLRFAILPRASAPSSRKWYCIFRFTAHNGLLVRRITVFCIVHCTIHLFHAFVFQRGRLIYAENGTIASRYVFDGRSGARPELRKEIPPPHQGKTTAEPQN